MTLTTGKEILDLADAEGYAVGAFNINNMEILQGIVNAAVSERSPVLIAVSEGAIKYAGIEYITSMVKTAANGTDIPIALHLDHGKDFGVILSCIRHGFTSLMIDASSKPLEENIKETKRVVEVAHPIGISVEAELGRLQGCDTDQP